MKKILLIGTMVVSTLASAQYNKVAVDLGFGANMAVRRAGKASNVNFPHVHLGARYNVSNLFGYKIGLDFNQFKFGYKQGNKLFSQHPTEAQKKAGEIDFVTNYFNFNILGVINLGNTFNISEWTDKVTFLGNFGPGFAINTSKSYKDVYPDDSGRNRKNELDKMWSLNGGVSLLYAVHPKVSIWGTIQATAHIQGDKNYDLDPRSAGTLETKGIDKAHGTIDIGLSYYIGKEAKHADFTPTQNGNPAEMEALKAKIAKAEKDMMDDDKDGVPNYLDQEAGTAEGARVDTKGITQKDVKVVDIDGDGILDVNDFCPTIKGVSSANGCPDKDGDNVYDFVDKCPNAAGLAADGGCPVVKEAVKSLMTKAMAGVQFDSGKTTIIKKSLPILDEVAKVMLANPAYNLAIDGHTDNVGVPAKNMELSDGRAKAVKAYLMGKGIAEGRLKATGYGDTKPKADNKTKKGQALNRRVEFTVSFQQ